MTRHRPPPPPPLLTARRVAIADGALLALSLTVAAAATFAPHPRQPVTVAAPTAVDLREPTGHGGPLTPPTFADPHVWNEDKGRVIVDGQALARPTVVLAPVVAPEPEPTPENLNEAAPVRAAASEPEPIPEPQPQPQPEPVVVPEPTDEPVVEEPAEPDVTEPVETDPAENTEPPAGPTVPVVVEVVP